jgi:nucleoside-diphosphate-sugar epimerase
VGLPGYEILNISGDSTVTLGEIIMQSKSITGRSPKVVEVSAEKVSLRNPTNKKAKSLLNWSPKISLADGLRSLQSHY